MITPLRRTVALIVSLAAALALSSCATPDSAGAPTPSPTVASSPLLEAVTSTVLDQQIVYPGTSQAQVSSSIITLPPGVETGLHKHDAPMYAYILSGELTVTYDGGVTKVYKTGEAIMEAVGTAHNGMNDSSADVKILVVNIGADGVANTVKLP